MAFGREHEVARPSAIPDWMKDFAEGALRREADGSNPFHEISDLFKKNKELSAIEERVREMKDRIGLNLLAERNASEGQAEPTVKTASARCGSVLRLVRLANWLDDNGLRAEAEEIDGILRDRAAVEELFGKYPKLQMFVDNVIRSRGGHVTIPAILKMIRDERPEGTEAASNQALCDYIEKRIGQEKREMVDSSDNIAGLGVGLSTSWEEMQEDNKMFEPSKPQR